MSKSYRTNGAVVLLLGPVGTSCYAPRLILVRVYLLYLYSTLYCTTGLLIHAYWTSVELIRDLDT